MDLQFFPTPPELARRAWAKFKNREFVRVLEPSAGDGALASQHPWETDRYHRCSTVIDCCEIDVTKHPILRAKGWNVVGLDFLQFGSGAIYSHILMNPPFSAGAAHVLKAFDALWDGEIVAILNAETLLNPFSAERRRLVDLVAKYGDVEYVEGAFAVDEAERKADVDIALVYLRKEADVATDIVGDLLGEMRSDAETGENLAGDYGEAQTLALPNSFIENSVLAFNVAVRAMRDAVHAEARNRYYTALIGETMAVRNGVGASSKQDSTIYWVKSELATRYDGLKDRSWAAMLRSTNVTSRLSSKAQRRIESEFEQIKKLEYTARNVYAFLCGLAESQGQIQLDMACDVFDQITKYHTDNGVFVMGWKSNDKHRTCGMRIKTTRFILPGHGTDRWQHSLSWESNQMLADFDRVFAMLDGRREPEVSLVSMFQQRFEDLRRGHRVSCSYFDARYHPGIGTIHFFPRQKALVDRLNRLVGRHRQWLPPEGEKVPDDFWKAYEMAERLDKEVREEVRLQHGSGSRWWNNPLDVFQPSDDDRNAAAGATITAALVAVLERHGIRVDAMLEHKPKQSQVQLPLLAA